MSLLVVLERFWLVLCCELKIGGQEIAQLLCINSLK